MKYEIYSKYSFEIYIETMDVLINGDRYDLVSIIEAHFDRIGLEDLS